MKKTRHRVVWAAAIALATSLCVHLWSLTVPIPELTPRWSGDQLQVAAPKLHFLTGDSLQRLRDGSAVPFDFQLTLSVVSRGGAVYRALERFVVSYDLWEERFKVAPLSGLRRSKEHLTASAAEAWCLENISIPGAQIPPGKNLWLKLEIRSADSKPSSAAPVEGGISLATLVDIFSRPTRNPQEHWQLETGPFMVADLKR